MSAKGSVRTTHHQSRPPPSSPARSLHHVENRYNQLAIDPPHGYRRNPCGRTAPASAIAASSEEPDPILPLIERYWKLDRAFERFLHRKGDAEDAAGCQTVPEWEALADPFHDAWQDAEWEGLTTPPTALPGATPVLAFRQKRIVYCEDHVAETAVEFIRLS
jgi:hypothetical protein